MGVGAASEHGFNREVAGCRVGGLWGWVWTMLWTIGWGTLIIDALARRGIMVSDSLTFSRSGLGRESRSLTQSLRSREENLISTYYICCLLYIQS
jgi:hypothetical protein